jgi:hypothetical protein
MVNVRVRDDRVRVRVRVRDDQFRLVLLMFFVCV